MEHDRRPGAHRTRSATILSGEKPGWASGASYCPSAVVRLKVCMYVQYVCKQGSQRELCCVYVCVCQCMFFPAQGRIHARMYVQYIYSKAYTFMSYYLGKCMEKNHGSTRSAGKQYYGGPPAQLRCLQKEQKGYMTSAAKKGLLCPTCRLLPMLRRAHTFPPFNPILGTHPFLYVVLLTGCSPQGLGKTRREEGVQLVLDLMLYHSTGLTETARWLRQDQVVFCLMYGLCNRHSKN